MVFGLSHRQEVLHQHLPDVVWNALEILTRLFFPPKILPLLELVPISCRILEPVLEEVVRIDKVCSSFESKRGMLPLVWCYTT